MFLTVGWFFCLLLLHLLLPCLKSDQYPNTAGSSSFAFLVPILSHSLPQRTHSGPRYLMPRPLPWDISSARLSTRLSLSEGPLRPSKFILLSHQFQEPSPLFKIIILTAHFTKLWNLKVRINPVGLWVKIPICCLSLYHIPSSWIYPEIRNSFRPKQSITLLP